MDTVVNDAHIPSRGSRTRVPAIVSQHEVGLRDILAMLWRRKMVIVATILVATSITAAIIAMLTPKYTATTSIAMERRGLNIGDWEQVATGLPGDEPTFISEMEVLRSKNLATVVVEKLDLTKNAEFNRKLVRQDGWINMLRNKFNLGSDSASNAGTRDGRLETRMSATVNEFLNSLRVEKVGKSSRVMQVSFSSVDPELAALVANTLSEAYLESQVKTKVEAAQLANELLYNQVETLRRQVEESDALVEQFRKDSGLLEGKDITLTAQKTAELNSQLVLAQAAWAEAEARSRQVQSLMASPDGIESAAQVLGSPLVKSLREQQATVERSLAELSMEYGPRHPAIIKLVAEKQDLESTIEEEVSKIIRGYENEVQIARTRYLSMRESLDGLEKEVGEANAASVELRSLEREARANQAILESFLLRIKETSAQQELGMFMPDAKIISYADVPDIPSFPRTKLYLALVAVLSAFLGLLIVFVLEDFDQGLRSAIDVEDGLGVPLLALVPAVASKQLAGQTVASYVSKNRGSAVAQSLRALHTGITLYNLEDAPNTILITSVQPAEGKTTTSSGLARIWAMTGAKVIVVDMDFHKPGLSDALDLDSEVGFADVLSGKATLESVICVDHETGAHCITAGNITTESASLIGSENSRAALDALRQKYDAVIIDSPPLLAVADARVLSGIADATVIVARWANTKRGVVNLGIRQIASSGGHLAGIVLSQVNVKKNAKYGYPDSGAYHGALSYYYTK